MLHSQTARRRRPSRTEVLFLALFSSPLFLVVGCPHRSPVWSPDSKHILLLARSGEEPVDRPAGGLWLIEVQSRKVERLADPAPGVSYLAAAWIDERSFVAFTAVSADGEVKEGSEAVWRGEIGAKGWTRVPGPQPSAERTPRRNPVAIKTPERTALVYAAGTESVVVVDLKSGQELLRMEPAELIGPGPGNGFLVFRPEGQTGGLELVAVGESLKPLWTKRYSVLSGEISERLGKKSVDIVINDASSSTRLGSPPGAEVAVTFVYADVSWREGISGYYARLDGMDGTPLAGATATAMPGRPGESAGTAWALTPASERGGDEAAVRSFPLQGGAPGAKVDLGLKKGAVHGYSLSPDGKQLWAVIAGPRVKVLIFTIEGAKVAGKPAEIEIGA